MSHLAVSAQNDHVLLCFPVENTEQVLELGLTVEQAHALAHSLIFMARNVADNLKEQDAKD